MKCNICDQDPCLCSEIDRMLDRAPRKHPVGVNWKLRAVTAKNHIDAALRECDIQQRAGNLTAEGHAALTKALKQRDES